MSGQADTSNTNRGFYTNSKPRKILRGKEVFNHERKGKQENEEAESITVGGKDARKLVFTCDGGNAKVKYEKGDIRYILWELRKSYTRWSKNFTPRAATRHSRVGQRGHRNLFGDDC